MGKPKKVDLDDTVSIPDDETLAAIDRAVKSADESRVVPLEKVR